MIKLDKIYTRGGDLGQTSLVDNSRVNKYCERIAAIGEIDLLNSIIGLAIEACKNTHIDESKILRSFQHDLFDLGADIATPILANESSKKKIHLRIVADQVLRIEEYIDKTASLLPTLKSFILPGGNWSAAYLHHARSQTRSAERSLCLLQKKHTINPHSLAYLNRLSDALFVMTRSVSVKDNCEVLWSPGKNH